MKLIPLLILAASLTITTSCSSSDANTAKESMRPHQAKAKLEERVKQSGTPTSDLTLAQGIRLMLDFYQDIRAQGCDLDDDGDMLLFQWGTYDWDGTGPTFQSDITRQFIKAGSEGDDGMTQLSFTFHFPPTAELERIHSGNKWCSVPKKLPKFEKFITDSEAFKAVADTLPSKVEIHYGGV